MKLQINNSILKIIKGNSKLDISKYSVFSKFKNVEYKKKDIIFVGGGKKNLRNIINLLIESEIELNITFIPKNHKKLTDYFKRKYKYIEAAGGVATKNKNALLIHRNGMWDLPKGKIEVGEKKKKAAIREVEEECGVKVELGDKICSTWHSYKFKGKIHLKQTYWYKMNCTDDSNMEPQIEEGIDKVEWKTNEKAKELLQNSYRNIANVFDAYLEL